MGSEIPEWAMEAADKVGEQIFGRHERGFIMWPLISDNDHLPAMNVARALVAAERRGIERAAEIAQRDSGMASGGYNPDFGPNVARRITCAIRQLGETP